MSSVIYTALAMTCAQNLHNNIEPAVAIFKGIIQHFMLDTRVEQTTLTTICSQQVISKGWLTS